ncbi:MAG: hypothetical protein EOP00_24935 [Pedobacter sp.]|nr:MAG: hypothetical protein EOP00_24935 [Pedobacter sp.]
MLKGKDTSYNENINLYLGNNYESLNKVDSSIYYYAEAVKFNEQNKNIASLSFLYSRLGYIELSFSHRYRSAIEYFKKQLACEVVQKDSISLFDCLNNIGLAYKSLKLNDSALLYFNKVSTNNSNHNQSKNAALLFIADTYSNQKRHNLALENYSKAIKYLSLANDSTNLCIAFANKGDCLMQMKRFDQSLQALQKAKDYLTPFISLTNKSSLYHNFAYVYSQQNNYDKAFYYKNLENLTKDSINTQSIGNAVAEMSAKYELRQQQDSLYISKQKLTLADLKAEERQRNFVILLVGATILALLLIAFYSNRQLRLRNKIQQQEATQNELQLTYQYKLSESELKAIRSQMNPHFIFNVLNSIESYIMDNEKAIASRLIQKFAGLSRLILENSTKSLVTADREWKALKLYTELEAMRYSNKFSFNFIVDENLELNTILLPPMLIQPLIENAILHGLIVEPKPDAHLEVSLLQIEDGLCITVSDNGVGVSDKVKTPSQKMLKQQSIGISSIKERLEMINAQCKSTMGKLTITPGPNDRGTIAKICLPMLHQNQMA